MHKNFIYKFCHTKERSSQLTSDKRMDKKHAIKFIKDILCTRFK